MDKNKNEIEFRNAFFLFYYFTLKMQQIQAHTILYLLFFFCYFHRIVDFDSSCNLLLMIFFPLLTSFIIGWLLSLSFFSIFILFYYILHMNLCVCIKDEHKNGY